MPLLYYFLDIAILSLVGFSVSIYIATKKQKKEVLLCPLHASCDVVTTSQYSKFFGVPIEYFGILYYLAIALYYFACLFSPDFHGGALALTLFFFSTGAFFFSVYLTLLQAIVLRSWCSWCLVSASISTVLFILSLLSLLSPLVGLLKHYHMVFIILHVVAFSVGVGAALLSDFFFYKFLKDLRISLYERGLLQIFSQVTWFSLGLILITGLALYLTDYQTLNHDSGFLLKMIIVAVILANGLLLNMVITPKLTSMYFGRVKNRLDALRGYRRLTFGLGSISTLSWLLVVILGNLTSHEVTLPFSLPALVELYVAFLIVAVILGQLIEYLVSCKTERSDA